MGLASALLAVGVERGVDMSGTALLLRQVMPRCACGKWGTYVGNYDKDGYTIRCSGCLRAIKECRC